LDVRDGTGMYVSDVAGELLRRGHTPIAYSTRLGGLANELRAATIPVVDNLASLSTAPDLIHGQHHIETMTALMHFPGVPAIFFCHGWLPWQEAPPHFPRILRYVAVDDTCRDRLVYEEAIPEKQVRVIRNFVDLELFKPRSPLPETPKRALIFSNYASEATYVGPVRQACERAGIELDTIGSVSGNPTSRPDLILGNYDIVFAKGRCAFEALAVGAAVIVCDQGGLGPMVTASEFDSLLALNFGVRALQNKMDSDLIGREIDRYDAQDAADVSCRIRSSAGREAAIDQLVALYEEVLAEHRATNGNGSIPEGQFVAAYLRQLAINLRREVTCFENQRDAVYQSASYRLGRALTQAPFVRGLAKRFSNRQNS
jgi:hypothetical protein